MLKVESRAALHKLTGEKPKEEKPDPLLGVGQALATLAAQMQKTNELVAQCMATKPEQTRPHELVADVERDSKGMMKRVIIRVGGA
jgi:hypothetical protein